jgi:hypothetical protein
MGVFLVHSSSRTCLSWTLWVNLEWRSKAIRGPFSSVVTHTVFQVWFLSCQPLAFDPLRTLSFLGPLAAWRTVRLRDEDRLIWPLLVTGCKIWHLRPESVFYPKVQFLNTIKKVPKGSQVTVASLSSNVLTTWAKSFFETFLTIGHHAVWRD